MTENIKKTRSNYTHIRNKCNGDKNVEKMHNANRNKKKKKLDWLYHKIDFERKQTGKNNIMD